MTGALFKLTKSGQIFTWSCVFGILQHGHLSIIKSSTDFPELNKSNQSKRQREKDAHYNSSQSMYQAVQVQHEQETKTQHVPKSQSQPKYSDVLRVENQQMTSKRINAKPFEAQSADAEKFKEEQGANPKSNTQKRLTHQQENAERAKIQYTVVNLPKSQRFAQRSEIYELETKKQQMENLQSNANKIKNVNKGSNAANNAFQHAKDLKKGESAESPGDQHNVIQHSERIQTQSKMGHQGANLSTNIETEKNAQIKDPDIIHKTTGTENVEFADKETERSGSHQTNVATYDYDYQNQDDGYFDYGCQDYENENQTVQRKHKNFRHYDYRQNWNNRNTYGHKKYGSNFRFNNYRPFNDYQRQAKYQSYIRNQEDYVGFNSPRNKYMANNNYYDNSYRNYNKNRRYYSNLHYERNPNDLQYGNNSFIIKKIIKNQLRKETSKLKVKLNGCKGIEICSHSRQCVSSCGNVCHKPCCHHC